MDSFQFAAALAGALAWPTAAVVLGITLRQSVVDLLARVKSLKAGGIEMTVAERSATAVEELPMAISPSLESAPPADQPALPESGLPSLKANSTDRRDSTVPADKVLFPVSMEPAADNNFAIMRPDGTRITANLWRQSADTSADSLILGAYNRLEEGLLRATPGPKSPGQAASTSVRQLLNANMVPESVAESVTSLRSIRNDVAHGRVRVSMIDAMTFDNAVQTVLNALKLAKYGSSSDVAAAITGQGEMATMSYADLRDRLARDAK